MQDVERELAAERASSQEAVGGSLDFYSCRGFLEIFFVAVPQNTGTTAAETAEGGVAVSGYQLVSNASMEHGTCSPGKQRSLMLQVFFLGFKWQKHPLKGNEQSFMKLRRSRCRGKLFKTKKMNLKSERCVDNKLIVSFIRLP